jgi:hypothetical protein
MDFPTYHLPNIPVITNVAVEIAKANYASKFAELLYKEIQTFDNELGEDFEVGVKLVSFGQTVVFAVHTIEYQNPSLIIFQGNNPEDSSPIKLIQHVTQINFLLTSLLRKEKEKPKQPIGFQG